MMTLILLIILVLLAVHYLPKSRRRARRHGHTTAYAREFNAIRPAILRRDGYRCRRCGKRGVPFHVHHIVYRSRGGTNAPSNLITLCVPCHEHIHGHKIF